MKKLLIIFLLTLSFSACGRAKEDKVALKIGDIKITAKEFDSAFKASGSSMQGEEGRSKFLDTYIARKLILKEAEKLGLDKKPEFLESVQLFWEQSLLKQMLAKKSQEIASSLNVGDKEISDYYEQRKEKHFPDKTLQEVYPQIKWILLQQKQGQELKGWVESLEKKVKIDADNELLGIAPSKSNKKEK